MRLASATAVIVVVAGCGQESGSPIRDQLGSIGVNESLPETSSENPRVTDLKHQLLRAGESANTFIEVPSLFALMKGL